jgi:hypothetical protein
MSGATSQRSSGIEYRGRYLPAAMGSSSAWTYTGTCQERARVPAAPEWSGWRWVNTIAVGRAPGPNTASAAVRIAVALLGQPASTSVQVAPEPTR